jgi:ComF family protein
MLGLSVAPALAGLGRAARRTIDVLLPARCLICGSIVAADGALCSGCWDKIDFLGSPCCACCGLPFELDEGCDALCGMCVARRPDFGRARAVFRYDDVSKSLILRFKHSDRIGAAPQFARWMARAGADLLRDADLIVPVPLNRWRLLARRYNQAALLGNAISNLSGVPTCPDALVRHRRTPSQGTMGRLYRYRNVRGAFRVARPERIAGKRVLLIDDVLTSGATTGECAKTLMRAGAIAVDVLTLARVVLDQV